MRIPALLAAVAMSFLAVAQPPTATPPAPQYQVEVLVFANRDFDPNEELFAQELTATGIDATAPLHDVPVFDESTFAAPPLGVPADGAVAQTTVFGFRLLRPEELQLGAEYQKLTRLPAYTPLLHGGWVQSGLPETESRPFDLALLGALNPRGSVRVYLSRFLHVNLDLTYEGAANATATPAAANELGEFTRAPRYQLVTERNVRSGELHYFDHPAFGVLVRITPVPTDTATATGRRPAA